MDGSIKKVFPTTILILLFLSSCGNMAQEAKVAKHEKLNLPAIQIEQPEQAPVAKGHQEIRNRLGNDIGQMNFYTNQAQTFRTYLTHSILSSSVSDYNGGLGASGITKIQFCLDGTFLQVQTSSTTVDYSGISGVDSGTSAIYGYWDVASLNNGYVILFYSEHPLWLEGSPNGFVPFLVAQFSDLAVLMPNGDGYQRTASVPCENF